MASSNTDGGYHERIERLVGLWAGSIVLYARGAGDGLTREATDARDTPGRSARRTTDDRNRPPTVDSLPLAWGGVYGALVWIGGVALTAIPGAALFDGGQPIVAGILLWHGANLTPLSAVLSGVNSLWIPTVAFPVFGLLVAGYRTASHSRTNGFPAGACVTAGYLPLAVTSHLFVRMAGGFGGGVPALPAGFLPELAFVGVVMPLVVGGIGGSLADL